MSIPIEIKRLLQLIASRDYRSLEGERLNQTEFYRSAMQAAGLDRGPAGPHAKPELTDPLATPGTGMLPSDSGGKDVDPGTG